MLGKVITINDKGDFLTVVRKAESFVSSVNSAYHCIINDDYVENMPVFFHFELVRFQERYGSKVVSRLYEGCDDFNRYGTKECEDEYAI